jgi:phage head maturation protease
MMPTLDISRPIRKQFELSAKGTTLEDNFLKGNASVTGVLDRGREVIFPGAWKSCLASFRQNGFVAVGHDWRALPVAMPTSVKEVGNQLQTEAQFHTTQAAQDARTVCTERLAKGLSVGLSVGFMLDFGDDESLPYVFFENGQKLLDFAKANGYDMSLFDTKGIKACKGYCLGILAIAELIEYSIVPIPCNQLAQATEAKGWATEISSKASEISTERDFEAFLREAGFSRKDATAVSLHGFKGRQRDAEENNDDNRAQDLTYRTLSLRMDALRTQGPK